MDLPWFYLRRKTGVFQRPTPSRSSAPWTNSAGLSRARRSSARPDSEQTKSILDTTTLAGQPIKATIANRLSLKNACIRSDGLTSLSNEDLLHELADQGVVRVERLRSKNVKELGPNPMVKVSFLDQPLQYLYCGYLRVRVDPWIPPVSQCTKCCDYDYSHLARFCRRRAETCGRCGTTGHPSDGCEAPSQCCHCGGPHPAWNRKCSLKEEALAQHRNKVKEARETNKQRFAQDQPDWQLGDFPALPVTQSRGKENQRTPQRGPLTRAQSQQPKNLQRRQQTRHQK